MKNNIITMKSHFPRTKRENRPTKVIVHAMGEYFFHKGRYMHAEEFLREIGLVAHLLVTPSGVGIKCLDGNICGSHAKGHNTHTLGVEFLVPGVHTLKTLYSDMKTNYVTPAAYRTGVEQVRKWIVEHNIQEVTTHSRVDPDRKQDPGIGFPAQFFTDVYN